MTRDDQLALDELRRRLEQDLDAMSPDHRRGLVRLVRELCAKESVALSALDESELDAFASGGTEIAQLQKYFGPRLNVALFGRRNGDV